MHSVRVGTSGLESLTGKASPIAASGYPLYTELMFNSDHNPQTKKGLQRTPTQFAPTGHFVSLCLLFTVCLARWTSFFCSKPCHCSLAWHILPKLQSVTHIPQALLILSHLEKLCSKTYLTPQSFIGLAVLWQSALAKGGNPQMWLG